jgi:hypothetical protein
MVDASGSSMVCISTDSFRRPGLNVIKLNQLAQQDDAPEVLTTDRQGQQSAIILRRTSSPMASFQGRCLWAEIS